MGVAPNVKRTLPGIIQGHIMSMRRYADELDELPTLIKRRDVVYRIIQCSNELEAVVKLFEKKDE